MLQVHNFVVIPACSNKHMSQSESKFVQNHLDSHALKDSQKMLRLVATTNSIEELCIGVEALFRNVGANINCSFHKLSDQVSSANRLQITFPSEWEESKSENEIIGYLQLSKPFLVSNVTSLENTHEGCSCIQVTSDSYLLIPALSSSQGLAWIKLHMLVVPDILHISKMDIESIQWTFFLQAERNTHNAICGMSSVSDSLLGSVFQIKENLTKRQNQIVRFVLEDMTNREIGNQLHISTSLVKLELGKIFKILSITNRKDLFSL